jgi:DNA topoisomerase-1
MKTPGTRLFRYRDGARWVNLDAADVNEYLGDLGTTRYTAKDFRTWGGTLRMAVVLDELGPAESARESAKNVALAARLVAAELGNTPAVCRASYVHPLIIARYVDAGVTIEPSSGASGGTAVRRRTGEGHSVEERALLSFLDRYFPDRRRRRVQRTRERREDSMAA